MHGWFDVLQEPQGSSGFQEGYFRQGAGDPTGSRDGRDIKKDKLEKLEFWEKFRNYIYSYSSDTLCYVTPVGMNEFTFTSTNSGKSYKIMVTEKEFKCTCPDHVHRNHDCKHIKDFIKLVEKFVNE